MARNDIQAVRSRNKFDQQRASAIANVMERLDVYEALTDWPTSDSMQSRRRQSHAEGIVDAVLAITKPQPEPVDVHRLAERMRREEGVQ